MGAGTKKTTTQNQTATNTPAAAADIQFGIDQGRNLFNTLGGRTFPDFSTVAGFSPTTQQGLDLTALRGLTGSPVNAAGQGAVTDIAGGGAFGPGGVPTNAAAEFFLPTARGDFLDFSNNPFFREGVDTINDSVGSVFERAGRTSSGANQSSLGRAVGSFGAGIFNQERSNQLNAAQALGNIFQGDINNQFSNTASRLNAASLAPGSAGTDFQDLQALLGAGGAFDAKNQQLIDEQTNRFNFPFDNAIQNSQLLNQNVGGLGPLLGGTQTGDSTTVEKTSGGLLNQILGAALTAAAAFGTGGASLAAGGAGGLFGGASETFSPSTIQSVLSGINPAQMSAPTGGFSLFPSAGGSTGPFSGQALPSLFGGGFG